MMYECIFQWLIDYDDDDDDDDIIIVQSDSMIDWLLWWYNYSTVRGTLTRIFKWLMHKLID